MLELEALTEVLDLSDIGYGDTLDTVTVWVVMNEDDAVRMSYGMKWLK